MTEIVKDPLVGKTIKEYVLTQKIDGGAFGAVYRAEHKRLAKPFAIKILHPHIATDAKFVERFQREARTLATLTHPNIVQLIDFDIDDRVGFYLVMEWLNGTPLKDFLKEERVLSFSKTFELFRQLLSGLAEAHAHGVVHRDLKPANLMILTSVGSLVLKILDFGVASLSSDVQALTLTGAALGSANYMSPEQAQGHTKEIDHRSDLYSCGVLLGQCLTGRKVFRGDNATQTMWKHISEAPPPLAQLCPERGFPPELEALFAKSLAKPKTERFQSATEFLDALSALAKKDLPFSVDDLDVPTEFSIEQEGPSSLSSSRSSTPFPKSNPFVPPHELSPAAPSFLVSPLQGVLEAAPPKPPSQGLPRDTVFEPLPSLPEKPRTSKTPPPASSPSSLGFHSLETPLDSSPSADDKPRPTSSRLPGASSSSASSASSSASSASSSASSASSSAPSSSRSSPPSASSAHSPPKEIPLPRLSPPPKSILPEDFDPPLTSLYTSQNRISPSSSTSAPSLASRLRTSPVSPSVSQTPRPPAPSPRPFAPGSSSKLWLFGLLLLGVALTVGIGIFWQHHLAERQRFLVSNQPSTLPELRPEDLDPSLRKKKTKTSKIGSRTRTSAASPGAENSPDAGASKVARFSLRLESEPSRAVIWIDGKRQRTRTPLSLSFPKDREIRVEVCKEGYQRPDVFYWSSVEDEKRTFRLKKDFLQLQGSCSLPTP